jgi:Glycosyl transferases group 1
MTVPSRRRAFVVGAYIPNGGTLMAYHLGRILQLDYGFEAVAVRVGTETADNGIHRYDPQFSSITISQMEAAIGDHDVLVCNPSFSSYMFGLRLPGRKICYVQHFNTFNLLDCRFDRYVAVSAVVSRFLSAVYGLAPRIISPFINIDSFPNATPWWSRPAGSTLVYAKGGGAILSPVMNRLRDLLSSRAPEIKLESILSDITLPQTEFMRRIGSHRHLLALSAAEGFGLVPLEAMAMGTTVIGFDGFGGRDYMRPGVNCAVAPYPDVELVADNLIAVTRSPELGTRLAQAGRATAACYTYAQFRSAWIEEFSQFLEMEPIKPQVQA